MNFSDVFKLWADQYACNSNQVVVIIQIGNFREWLLLFQNVLVHNGDCRENGLISASLEDLENLKHPVNHFSTIILCQAVPHISLGQVWLRSESLRNWCDWRKLDVHWTLLNLLNWNPELASLSLDRLTFRFFRRVSGFTFIKVWVLFKFYHSFDQ